MPFQYPPLLALRAFEAAARHLSFTAAAAELHVTQGAISRQIRLLEDFLGRKMFERFVRRIELTPAGHEYFRDVQAALAEIEKATQRAMRTDDRVVVKVAVLPTLGSSWLMPRLARFSATYPHIDVRVITSIEPANFQTGDIDVAIRVGRLPGVPYRKEQPRIDLEMATNWRGVLAEYLFADVLVPVMSRKLLEKGKPIHCPQDLLSYPLIHTASRQNAWPDWLAAHGIRLDVSKSFIDFGHFFIGIRAAQDCRGIAIVPTVVCRHAQPEQDLFCPLAADIESAGAYYVLSRESRSEDPAIQIIRKWIITEASELKDELKQVNSQARPARRP
jgi:LysR family glycine cleavage system transcriptional activator